MGSFFSELSNNQGICTDYILLNYDSINWEKEGHLFRVLVKENKTESFLSVLKKNGFAEVTHPRGVLAGYRMLYQITEPLLFEFQGSYLEVWNQLCCTSYFQDCWLPLDKAINSTVWYDVKVDKGIPLLGDANRMVFNITNAFFTDKQFNPKTKDYLKRNTKLLELSETIEKLQKEFFGFTPILVQMIRNDSLDNVFDEYKSFIDY